MCNLHQYYVSQLFHFICPCLLVVSPYFAPSLTTFSTCHCSPRAHQKPYCIGDTVLPWLHGNYYSHSSPVYFLHIQHTVYFIPNLEALILLICVIAHLDMVKMYNQMSTDMKQYISMNIQKTLEEQHQDFWANSIRTRPSLQQTEQTNGFREAKTRR